VQARKYDATIQDLRTVISNISTERENYYLGCLKTLGRCPRSSMPQAKYFIFTITQFIARQE
jgi:hypothetical protein